MIPLSFQWKAFEQERQIVAGSEVLIVSFSGREAPLILKAISAETGKSFQTLIE
jgi:hypothetical protein